MESVRPAIVALLALLALLILHSGAPPPATADPRVSSKSLWRLVREGDGIRSYSRALRDSDLLAFKGEVILDAPIDRVLSVVLDAEHVGEWIPRLIESTVLEWIREPHEYIQFTRFDAPWPVLDRVFLSRVVLEIDPATSRTSLRYYNTQSHEMPKRASDVAAIQGLTGGSFYLLEPTDRGRATRLIAVSIADPKGSIPAWLINWVGKSWAYDTMSSLRAQVQKSDIDLLPMVQGLYPGDLSAPLR